LPAQRFQSLSHWGAFTALVEVERFPGEAPRVRAFDPPQMVSL